MLQRVLSFSALFLAISSVALAQQTATPAADPLQYTVLVVSSPIVERRDPLDIFGSAGATIHELNNAVRKYKDDPGVDGLVVRFEPPIDWTPAKALSFSRALKDFKQSGKPLHANFDVGDLLTYMAAAQADKITMPPVGLLDLRGYGAQLYYAQEMLGKLGVQADVVTIGEYKNALEPLTRNEPSEETRESIGLLLDDIFGSISEVVAEGRGWDADRAFEVLTEGPYFTASAVEAGAITEAVYIEDLPAFIEEEAGAPVEANWVYSWDLAPTVEPPSFMEILMGGAQFGGRRIPAGGIAVVYALGQVVDGRVRQSNPFESVQAIASEDFIDLLDEAMADEPAALVVRIDSPGGSAIASDRIWAHLSSIREDIPVIVSMGDVAASGGYYIAMAGDLIVCEAATITGSIGVVGGKLSLEETYEMIGVTMEPMTIGERADLFSEGHLWTDEEREVVRTLMTGIYEEFVRKASESREMPLEEMRELAKGRIWSGKAALDRGLVDRLGGLDDAIALARQVANAPDAAVTEYPKELTFFELLDRLMTGQVQVGGFHGSGAQAAIEQVLPLPPAVMERARFFAETLRPGRPAAMAVLPLVIHFQ